jgi:cysteine desulfurase / selenocysteine lyase
MDDVAYLDYAATAARRPPEVVEAVTGYLRDVGATPGRGGHRGSVDAARIVLRCRRALAELLGIPGDPGRVTLHLNATHALNAALAGLLAPGDRVVRTSYDHNAVRRPVLALAARGVRSTVLGGDARGTLDMEELDRALRGARLLVVPHASNVLGTALPLRELAGRAHAAGALLLVDAAQSAGHLPIDAAASGIDLLAFSGHKGLLGPQGTGGLWVREGVEVAPTLFGGTGGDSDADGMPHLLPDRLEAGSMNGPGIAGLLAGVEWVASRGIGALHRREEELKAALHASLAAIPRVRVLSPATPDGTGIVTIRIDGTDPAHGAGRLDREHGVLCRAGLHCAPETHALLGTSRGGALRFSLGWASSDRDVERAAGAVRSIAAETPGPGAG